MFIKQIRLDFVILYRRFFIKQKWGWIAMTCPAFFWRMERYGTINLHLYKFVWKRVKDFGSLESGEKSKSNSHSLTKTLSHSSRSVLFSGIWKFFLLNWSLTQPLVLILSPSLHCEDDTTNVTPTSWLLLKLSCDRWYDANLRGNHDFICLRHSSFLDLLAINHFTLLDLKVLC